MTKKLLLQIIIKMTGGILLVGLLIFLPAGTLSYFNGWLLICSLFIPMFFLGIVLMIKSPQRLKKRLNTEEKHTEQKMIVMLSGIMFVLGFIAAGLCYRWEWYTLPYEISAVATITFLTAYAVYVEVIRENAYLSRIIEVEDNQKVIDTGLYSIVRHPMYSATIILFLSMPLILGSIHSFVIFLVYPFIIIKRIKGEEEFLEKELEGYIEYKQRVRYRLIPFVY